MVGGTITPGGALMTTMATQCLTDTFTMTGVSGGVPPTICGTNTGYHGSWKFKTYNFDAFFNRSFPSFC